MTAASKQAVPSYDLLIVGPGVLGSYLGVLWQQRHPGARVVGQTNTTDSHERCELNVCTYPPQRLLQLSRKMLSG